VLGDDELPQTVGSVEWVPKTVRVGEGGAIYFSKDGDSGVVLPPVHNVDVIIFCTGYDYGFSFLNGQSNLELSAIKGERVSHHFLNKCGTPIIPM